MLKMRNHVVVVVHVKPILAAKHGALVNEMVAKLKKNFQALSFDDGNLRLWVFSQDIAI